MNKEKAKQFKKIRRHHRVRAKVAGAMERPRLNVFRSNKEVYLQVIDDTQGITLVSAHTKELKSKDNKTDMSKALGKLIAERAIAKNIKSVVFDRGSYRYHGRVRAVAEGAREGGLEF